MPRPGLAINSRQYLVLLCVCIYSVVTISIFFGLSSMFSFSSKTPESKTTIRAIIGFESAHCNDYSILFPIHYIRVRCLVVFLCDDDNFFPSIRFLCLPCTCENNNKTSIATSKTMLVDLLRDLLFYS